MTLDSAPQTRRWTVVTEPSGAVSYRCDELSFDERVLEAIQDGERSATEIAEHLKTAKSNVSRAATRLHENKLIEKRGNGNRITYEPRGFMRNETH